VCVHALSWALKQTIGRSSEKFLLVLLCNYADENGYAYPSVTTLCRASEQDRKTVMSNLQSLSENGFIADSGRRVGQTKSVTVWRIIDYHDPHRSSPENGIAQAVPKTGQLSEESGTVFPMKQYRFSHEAVPKTVHRSIREPSEGTKNPPSPPAAQGGRRTKQPRVESEGFKALRAIYPKRAGSQRYDDANRFYEARLREGDGHEAIVAGAKRYAALKEALGEVGTDKVMQLATFLGSNRCYLEPHEIPIEKPKETAAQRADRERKEAMRAIWSDGKRRGLDFRNPFGHESPDDYRAELEAAIKRRDSSGKPFDVGAAVAALKNMSTE
jgi:hypothetical protein